METKEEFDMISTLADLHKATEIYRSTCSLLHIWNRIYFATYVNFV